MKTVFITGTSSGIGKEAAKLFASKGWEVIASMRSPEKETELTEIENVKVIKLDVSDIDSVREGIAKAYEVATDGKIDVLVNNAGYGAFGVFESSTPEEVQKQYQTNVFGLMDMCREILPKFRKQVGGMIINIASVGGRTALPLYSVYNSTKWAVEGFSEGLMYELRQFGIVVKMIEPGIIKTNFSGSSRKTHTKVMPEYESFEKKVKENYAAMTESKGITPDKVAKLIYKAATDGSKRLRYDIGYPTKLMFFTRRFLPLDWVFAIFRAQMAI